MMREAEGGKTAVVTQKRSSRELTRVVTMETTTVRVTATAYRSLLEQARCQALMGTKAFIFITIKLCNVFILVLQMRN